MTIKNDQDFKQALSGLSIVEQRKLAAQFIESVEKLNDDPLIERALKTAKVESSDNEIEDVYRQVKSLAVKTYTSCGDETDWSSQAAHFVVTATKACLTPLPHLGNKNNLAWKCAMQTRMARNCEMIEADSDVVDNEAQKQYLIANDFLATSAETK
ncbi:MAG: hypothetical protein OQL19_03895 [Gammaproteobacteria bacterium]|nr:hypothetical protein [Gammaproteobacteria bacterium]